VELGAEVLAGGDNRLGAAQAGQQPAKQMLAQRSIRRQRTMRLQNGAGGSVVIQQPQLDIFNQQQQALIQRACSCSILPAAGSGPGSRRSKDFRWVSVPLRCRRTPAGRETGWDSAATAIPEPAEPPCFPPPATAYRSAEIHPE
jgi:hypothetical protein